jgi:hypothetical protein
MSTGNTSAYGRRDGEWVHRPALYARAGAVASWALVGAGGGGVLLLYAQRPDHTRQAMAAAGVPELQFDLEFSGGYASEYA